MKLIQDIREIWKHPVGKITIALALITMMVSAVIATYWIYSNITPKVTLGYSLELTHSLLGSKVTLTAILDNNAVPVVGAVIHFYRCNSDGSGKIELNTATTISGGVATYQWDIPSNGDWYFIAGYEVA